MTEDFYEKFKEYIEKANDNVFWNAILGSSFSGFFENIKYDPAEHSPIFKPKYTQESEIGRAHV